MKQNKVGIGTRVVNFVVDTAVVFLIAYGIKRSWDFNVYYWNYKELPFYTFMAVISVMYYFLFESICGRTIGKFITLTKVVTTDDAKVKPLAVLSRSILRLFPLDFLLIPFKDVTVHDYLTKTKVVEI